jgi:hypothetical protein
MTKLIQPCVVNFLVKLESFKVDDLGHEGRAPDICRLNPPPATAGEVASAYRYTL